MFETGIRQFRMAICMGFGRRFDVSVIDRLVGDLLATLDEFGSPGDDADQVLGGLFADPDARANLQNRALQRTARRLASTSPFYRARFSELGMQPKDLTVDTVTAVPVTVKKDLVLRQRDFFCSDSRPYVATRTTGTTGTPAEVWLSRYEVDLWSALITLAMLLRGEFHPDDHLQVNISSRATAVIHENLRMCELTGASIRILGMIPPDETLDSLLAGDHIAPTFMNTYPSYLAELVQAARRRELSAADFRLKQIITGGEVLSSPLAAAASDIFGVDRIESPYGMTEILPVSARTCRQEHLHLDLNMGFYEVINLTSGEPAVPGELGTLVVTPYFPYRECMPVFRYDTRDVVRSIPEASLDCELTGMPAVSPILGKADHLLFPRSHIVTTRDIVEVLEALPSEPWPARFQARVEGGRIHLSVPESTLEGLTAREVEQCFAARGIDAQVHVVQIDARTLRHLRSDLRESTFTRSVA